MHKPTKLKKLLIARLILALAPLASPKVLAQEQREEGLIACWHFDEGSGDTCADSSGNANHGRIVGASWVDGKHGKALKFDGVDDYVDCGRGPTLNVGDSITIELWLKADRFVNNIGIVQKMAKWRTDNFLLRINGNGGVVFVTGADKDCASRIRLNAGKWYHVAAVYKKNDYKTVYINGVEDVFARVDRPSGTITANGEKVRIGRDPNSAITLSGTIDEVKIYNRALTDEEIRRRCGEEVSMTLPPIMVYADSPRAFATLYHVKRMLGLAGLPADTLPVRALKSYPLYYADKLIVVDAALNAEYEKGVTDYVRAGGKVLAVGERMSEWLARLLDVSLRRPARPKYSRQFAVIRFIPNALPGLPESLHLRYAKPAFLAPEQKGKVAATWFDGKGKDTGLPAVVLSDNGAFVGCSFARPNRFNEEAKLMTAAIGHLVPEPWQTAIEAVLARVGHISSHGSRRKISEVLAECRAQGKNTGESEKRLTASELLAKQSRDCLAKREHAEAYGLALDARKMAESAYYLLFTPQEGEIRGIWFGSFPQSCSWTESVELIARHGFNTIYISSLRAPEELLAAAKPHGIHVAPFPGPYTYGYGYWPDLQQLREQGRLQVGRDGGELTWLCPSQAVNRKTICDGLLAWAGKHDADGIQLDIIRYRSGNFCYCERCRENSERDTGIVIKQWPKDAFTLRSAEYGNWRAEQVSRLVKEFGAELRKRKPHMTFSAAVFSKWRNCPSISSIGQDPRSWVEKNYLDVVCSMTYTPSMTDFRSRAEEQVALSDGKPTLLCVGLGSYVLPGPVALIDQIQLTRDLGADGFVLFDYTQRLAGDFLPALSDGITAEPTYTPLLAPRVVFAFDGFSSEAARLTYRAGEPINVQITMSAEPRNRQAIQSAQGTVHLETISGERKGVLCKISATLGHEGQASIGALEAEPGHYRLAVYGKATFADGTVKPFVTRSRFFHVELR